MKTTNFFLSWTLMILASSVFASPPLQPITEVFEPQGSFPSSQYWKVAVVQWNPPDDAPIGPTPDQASAYKLKNRNLMEQKIREAASKGAQFVVFSEFATIGYPAIPNVPPEDDNYRDRSDIQPYVETIPGDSTKYFGGLAKELGVWIQFGMAEVDGITQIYYDDAVVLNSDGQLVAKYRKQNLYEEEANFISPGDANVTYDSPIGKVGFLVCSDVYSSPVLDKYKQLKVDVLALSTSWAEQNTGINNFIAAAQRVGAYLLAANQDYFPDSGVINRDGSLQSHIRQTLNAIAYGYIPLKK